MNRIAITLLVGLLAIGLMGSTAFVVAAQANDDPLPEQADENASVQPGERLTGAIGVHEAELEGDLETRTFGLQIAQSATDAAKADVVATNLAENEARLAELEARIDELRAQREAGDITEGQYRAQVAIAATQLGNVDRAVNASQAAAGDLPVELLEDRGINTTAILELRERAHELSGHEVREIARSIAGNQTDTPRGPPDETPPIEPPVDPITPDVSTSDAQEAIDAAEASIDEVANQLDVVELDGQNVSAEAIDEARENLEEARNALDLAREELAAGNADEALALAKEALDKAEAVLEMRADAIGTIGTDTDEDDER